MYLETANRKPFWISLQVVVTMATVYILSIHNMMTSPSVMVERIYMFAVDLP